MPAPIDLSCDIRVEVLSRYDVEFTNRSGVPIQVSPSGMDETYDLVHGAIVRVPRTTLGHTFSVRLDPNFENQMVVAHGKLAAEHEALQAESSGIERMREQDLARSDPETHGAAEKRRLEVDAFVAKEGMTPSQERLKEGCRLVTREECGWYSDPLSEEPLWECADFEEETWQCDEMRDPVIWDSVGRGDYIVTVRFTPSREVAEWDERKERFDNKARRLNTVMAMVEASRGEQNFYSRCFGEQSVPPSDFEMRGLSPNGALGLGATSWVPPSANDWSSWAGIGFHAEADVAFVREAAVSRALFLRPYLTFGLTHMRWASGGEQEAAVALQAETARLRQTLVPVGLTAKVFAYPIVWVDVGGGARFVVANSLQSDGAEGSVVVEGALADTGPIVGWYANARLGIPLRGQDALGRRRPYDGVYIAASGFLHQAPYWEFTEAAMLAPFNKGTRSQIGVAGAFVFGIAG